MTKAQKSELGRLLSSLRKNTKNAGRKKLLRPCPRCGNEFGARELRAHRCDGTVQRTPISSRKGIQISETTRELYERRDKSLDNEPDARQLPPEKWAKAMRREEFFRPSKMEREQKR